MFAWFALKCGGKDINAVDTAVNGVHFHWPGWCTERKRKSVHSAVGVAECRHRWTSELRMCYLKAEFSFY